MKGSREWGVGKLSRPQGARFQPTLGYKDFFAPLAGEALNLNFLAHFFPYSLLPTPYSRPEGVNKFVVRTLVLVLSTLCAYYEPINFNLTDYC